MDMSNVDTVFVGGRVKKGMASSSARTSISFAPAPRSRGSNLLAQDKWPGTVLGGHLPGH